MSFVLASGWMHQQMSFWGTPEKEYPLMGTSDLSLLFIASVTIAPRSYIHERNELGATGTTSAPRSLRANAREEKPLGNPRAKRRLHWQRWSEWSPCSYHTDGRQGGIGQTTVQLGRKQKDAGWRSKVGNDGCFQSWWSLCWLWDAEWELVAGAVSSDRLQQRLGVCSASRAQVWSCNLCILSEGLGIWISNVKYLQSLGHQDITKQETFVKIIW